MKKEIKNRDFVPGLVEYSKFEPEFGYYINEQGERVFGVVGQIDSYAKIQEFADNCDFEIFKSYLMASYTGDDNGYYGVRPDAIHDVNDFALFKDNLNKAYNALPDVVKDKFKDVLELINGYNEEDFKDYLSSVSTFETNTGDTEDEKK